MKCSSGLLFGLLVSCLCVGVTGSSEELTVNQSPPNIIVNEGDSAQITCCWNNIEYKVKVSWFINEKKLSGVKEELQYHQIHQIQNCSTLRLTNIFKNNTGRYVCQVTQDIPFLLELKGNGTVISVRVSQLKETTTVSPSPQTTQAHISTIPPSHLTLPLSLAALIGLGTLCLALILLSCKMSNSSKKSERVVIRQTPHNDGEEHEHVEEEDGSTGSSRGSLQWCQVPVYWSYFDVQRGEEEQ